MSAVYLAFDLGAESGRAVLGRFDEEHVTLEEVHRFPNTPVKLSDGLYWDVLLILAEIKVRDKDGKVKGYRAAFVVHTAEGMKRRYLWQEARGRPRQVGEGPLRPGRRPRLRRRSLDSGGVPRSLA